MTHHQVDLENLLHDQGYRVTPQRQLVLDAVCEIGDHARPEEIYETVHEKAPAVHRVTVYRTLKLLCKLGLITETVAAEGYHVYEIASEQPHHHLVCRQCGIDIEFANLDYSEFVGVLQRQHNFLIETTHLTLSGLCQECQMSYQ